MNESNNRLTSVVNGIINEKFAAMLLMGIFPAAFVTNSVKNAIALGIVFFVTYVISAAAVSALHDFFNPSGQKALIWIFTLGISVLITVTFRALFPELGDELGVYLTLTAISVLLIMKGDKYSINNSVINSFLHSVILGGFITILLFIVATIRELFGAGTWFGMQVLPQSADTLFVLNSSSGGIFVIGCAIALINFVVCKKFKYSSDNYCEVSKLYSFEKEEDKGIKEEAQ